MDFTNDVSTNPRVVDHPRGNPFSRISWGAIFGGVFFGLALFVTLVLFGAAVGITTIDPWSHQNPKGLAIGQGIWLVLSGIIAFFFAGWTTGILSGYVRKLHGTLNGLVVWGIMTIFMLLAGTSAVGAVLSGGLGLLKAGASAVGNAAQSAAPALMQQAENFGITDSAANKLRSMFNNLDQNDKQTVGAIVSRSVSKGQLSDEDRRTLTGMVSKAANVPQQQADSTIDAWAKSLQKTGSKVQAQTKEVAETASNVAAKATWAIFIMMLLNGLAAAIGGSVGVAQGETEPGRTLGTKPIR